MPEISKFSQVSLSSAFLYAVLSAASPAKAEEAPQDSCQLYQEGQASWYGGFHAGRRMANGRPFNPNAATIAHRELPLGTQVRIVLEGNTGPSREVFARVTDRGPYARRRGKYSRVADLSESLARDLNMRNAGVAHVRLYRCNTAHIG